ncbi:MAG: DinB family protein, partial [Acidobacteria bacterium]|nr:DinB family protein [Acidobacteriota bacterium]
MPVLTSEPGVELRQELLSTFRCTRQLSLELVAPLEAEDFRVQSMPDVSPPWWNLGHTSWFFGRNILKPFGLYLPQDERLEYVMNSYYEALGERIPRAERGLATRPTTNEVRAFRRSVDERMARLIEEVPEEDLERLSFLVTTGIQHEQQHQELLVTEIKHILGSNVRALRSAYHRLPAPGGEETPQLSLLPVSGGLLDFGHCGTSWAWDNEQPRHKAYLEDFRIASRLVTNGEYREFVEDG